MFNAPFRPFEWGNLKIGPRKGINYLGNKLSRRFRLDRAWLYPHRVDLEATNLCNLGCQMCPTGYRAGKREKRHMTFAEFRKVFEPLAPYAAMVQLAGYGEPFLNHDVFDMIDFLKRHGVYTDIYSNILPLKTEGMKRLIEAQADRVTVSLDSVNPSTYYEYKRVHGYDQTIEKLRELVLLRKARRSRFPLVNLQFVVMKLNETQVPEARRIAHDIGADTFSPKTANLLNVSKDWKKKRFDEPAESFHRSPLFRPRASCPWIWDGFILYANGDVGPCCYDGQVENVFGNAFSKSILEIWNGPAMSGFRKAFTKNHNHARICAGCTAKFKLA